MRILIAGDTVPTTSNEKLFAAGDLKRLLGDELSSLWADIPHKIMNIEAPITDKTKKILKCGPNLSITPSVMEGFKRLNISIANLANNHILDYDSSGLQDTIKYFHKLNVKTVGAGNNLSDARKPVTINEDGITVGIYACAEHEFSIASPNDPGANPFDPFTSLDHIRQIKNDCDYLIVLYHGGKEHSRYPSPYLQKVCRNISNRGADLIICQHSHAIGCEEKYNDSHILYGQGNFIFDYNDGESWQSGLLVDININSNCEVKYIPIVKDTNCIKIPNDITAKKIMDDFWSRSENIKNGDFIHEIFSKLVHSEMDKYISSISFFPSLLEKIDRKVFNKYFFNKFVSRGDLLRALNYIECEAHREMLIEGLKEKIKS